MIGPAAFKEEMRSFWDAASCGEALLLPSIDRAGFEAQARERYRLEPYIEDFARFPKSAGRRVLEIGVGLGADHQRFAEAGALLSGIDLTQRAVEFTRKRLALFGLSSDVQVGDAESLPFESEMFDYVYSWGVIHHSPDTAKAAREILRVLRPGGRFAVMIYKRRSIVGALLWTRYALLSGRPFTSLDAIYSRHLESAGTKAYSEEQGKALFSGAARVCARSVLTHADLLESGAGQRHRGLLLSIFQKIWPRKLIRWLLPSWGLFLLIEGTR